MSSHVHCSITTSTTTLAHWPHDMTVDVCAVYIVAWVIPGLAIISITGQVNIPRLAIHLHHNGLLIFYSLYIMPCASPDVARCRASPVSPFPEACGSPRDALSVEAENVNPNLIELLV